MQLYPSLRVENLDKIFEILLHVRFVSCPSFVNVIYLYQSGLMDIYFILGVITQYYINFVAQSAPVWPLINGCFSGLPWNFFFFSHGPLTGTCHGQLFLIFWHYVCLFQFYVPRRSCLLHLTNWEKKKWLLHWREFENHCKTFQHLPPSTSL